MKRLLKRFLITLALVVAAFLALFTCSYFLLWKPSLQGKCGGRMFGSPEPARPRLARFRGEVVGKNLSIVQYRWLRRRFRRSPYKAGRGREPREAKRTPRDRPNPIAGRARRTVRQRHIALDSEHLLAASAARPANFHTLTRTRGSFSVSWRYGGIVS